MPLDCWIAYGQTTVPFQTAADNPPCNANGLVGECTSLPYTVPAGKVLLLDSYGIEAYATAVGGMVLVPWIGEAPATNAKCLMSCYSDNSSNEIVGGRYAIPAGKKLNLRIMCSENPPSVCGWYMSGRLVDAT